MLAKRKGGAGTDAAAAQDQTGHATSGKTAQVEPSGIGGAISEILWGSKKRQGMVEAMAKSTARTVGNTVGRQILRGVLGGIFGGSKKR